MDLGKQVSNVGEKSIMFLNVILYLLWGVVQTETFYGVAIVYKVSLLNKILNQNVLEQSHVIDCGHAKW